MATTLGDAKVRITIDRSQARREAEAQRTEEKREEEARARDEERRARDQKRGSRRGPSAPSRDEERAGLGPRGRGDGGSRARQAVQRSVSDLRSGRPLSAIVSVLASIPGVEVAGVALGLGVLAEEAGPLAGGIVSGLVPAGAARDSVRAAYEGLDTAAIEKIRELRSLISAGYQLQEQLRALATARILAADSPEDANFDGLGTLGRALFEANQAMSRIERDRKSLTRRVVGEVVGNQMRDLFSGAMGGQ